jgi:hypothetical protein
LPSDFAIVVWLGSGANALHAAVAFASDEHRVARTCGFQGEADGPRSIGDGVRQMWPLVAIENIVSNLQRLFVARIIAGDDRQLRATIEHVTDARTEVAILAAWATHDADDAAAASLA